MREDSIIQTNSNIKENIFRLKIFRYKKIPPGRWEGGRRADTRRAQAMAANSYTVLLSQAVDHGNTPTGVGKTRPAEGIAAAAAPSPRSALPATRWGKGQCARLPG